jgi:hypothetical protein
MEELAATWVAELTKGHGNDGYKIRLAEEWRWLLPAESETQVCEEELVETY